MLKDPPGSPEDPWLDPLISQDIPKDLQKIPNVSPEIPEDPQEIPSVSPEIPTLKALTEEQKAKIEDYKTQIQILNTEITRLKTAIMEAPDPVDLVRLQERNKGLNLVIAEKEKRIEDLTREVTTLNGFAHYFKTAEVKQIEAPAAEKVKPW